tara:strand:- start:54 stop:290 length:237 start_codon:yes stop_codon:yes gene_type:complete
MFLREQKLLSLATKMSLTPAQAAWLPAIFDKAADMAEMSHDLFCRHMETSQELRDYIKASIVRCSQDIALSVYTTPEV